MTCCKYDRRRTQDCNYFSSLHERRMTRVTLWASPGSCVGRRGRQKTMIVITCMFLACNTWTALGVSALAYGTSRCRTTRSCIMGPYHQGCGPDSIEKDSRLARRADRSRQRQARLHTVSVGFGLAEGQPSCEVGRRPSLCALYPSHES